MRPGGLFFLFFLSFLPSLNNNQTTWASSRSTCSIVDSQTELVTVVIFHSPDQENAWKDVSPWARSVDKVRPLWNFNASTGCCTFNCTTMDVLSRTSQTRWILSYSNNPLMVDQLLRRDCRPNNAGTLYGHVNNSPHATQPGNLPECLAYFNSGK